MSEDFDRGWLAIFCPALLIDDEQREYILILLVVVDLKSVFSLQLPWYCFDVTYMHVNLYLNVPLLLSLFFFHANVINLMSSGCFYVGLENAMNKNQ